MIRRGIILASAATLLLVGGVAGAAYAATTTDVGSFGLDVKEVQEVFTSPPTGAQLYKIQCPTGYTPLGGGGVAIPSSGNSRLELLGSAPYDDGNRGWGVTFDAPASSWTIYGYASCVKVS